VGGNFYCDDNQLTTLVGGPVTVRGTFSCSDNKLTSLVGGPVTVGEKFHCFANNLTSTYSGDTDIEVSGDVYFTDDKFPEAFANNYDHIKTIMKYQRHFEIWNDDLSLNIANFTELIEEISDGLQ